MMFPPHNQGELLKWTRGSSSQAEFAARTGVAKSSLSRYESEKLGAPTHLINYCLARLAEAMAEHPSNGMTIEEALSNAQRTVALLQGLQGHSKPD